MTAQTTITAAEYVRNTFFVSAEIGVDLKELVRAEYWAHVARQLHIGDHIEVLAIDGAYYAELIVLAVGATWARVLVINHVVNAVADKPSIAPDSFYVKWSSPSTKFRVHRTADKSVVSDGFETAEMAKEWLAKYERDNYQSAA